MAKAPRLKVYCMPAGFYDAVVAAPSQKAALKAWGTITDLFAAGRASVVEDEALRAEAMARPGEVIRKSRGDEAAMLGPEPEPRRTPETAKAAAPRRAPSAKPAPPPPDRSALDAAERALAEAEQEISAEREAFSAERADLERREAAAERAAAARLRDLRRDRDREAAAFERASRRHAR